MTLEQIRETEGGKSTRFFKEPDCENPSPRQNARPSPDSVSDCLWASHVILSRYGRITSLNAINSNTCYENWNDMVKFNGL